MNLKNINPTKTKSWHALAEHFQEMKTITMKEMFANDTNRAEKFHIQWHDFLVDYSKNRINQTTIDLLLQLAEEVALKDAIEQYFEGEKINKTEDRAVLHTALRSPINQNIMAEGQAIFQEIEASKAKMAHFTNQIVNGEMKGYTGKAFTDVVNIGIGGSDLGPVMVIEALQFYKNHLNIHFVSNIDGDQVMEVLPKLDPETTLFVIVSKTFTTQETLTNAETIKKWFLKSATQDDIAKHFVAVSTNTEKVEAFGIDAHNIFTMWDWVGGRFSVWSAVGLTVSLSIGYDNFDKFLKGANLMDNHFKTTSFDKNIPVVLALISVWYNNFWQAESEAIIPYTHYLQKLSSYLQQGIMESNGKSVDRNGNKVDYQTGTIIWGEPGSNSQHAFFQLIHQGTKLIPADFIGFTKPLHGNTDHHNKLMSNFFAQTEALLNGKTAAQVETEFTKNDYATGKAEFILPFKIFEGNKPTNTLLIDQLTPESLGSLVAMYEHKIFVQGIVWNIFSYDQWGVELGKQLANKVLTEIESQDIKQHDGSTTFLLNHYLKHKI